MPIRSRTIAAAVIAAATSIATFATPWAAASATDAPTLTVTPAKHLRNGDTVHLAASGIAPGTPVRIIQCDQFNDDPEQDCPNVTTVTSSSTGRLALDVTVKDFLFRNQPFGDPRPIYCRADICRLFAVWPDATGTNQSAATRELHFIGSPATISVSPSTNLYANETVHVTGTAYGAGPRRVQVSEEACYSIVQGSGCYGQLKVRTLRAQSDGSFSLSYTVHRYLSDGTDCADANNILGACEVTATILKADGTPDNSFGLSSRGQPAAFLTFRTG
jgi:hypothetical protein